MPYTKSTQKKYGDNPMKKKTGFKMKGFSGFMKEGPVKPKSIVAAKEKEEEKDSVGDIGFSDETPEHFKLHFGRRAKKYGDYSDSRPD